MSDRKKRTEPSYGWWIAGILLLTMLSFIFDIWGDKKVIREHPLVEQKYYSTDPVRQSIAKAKAEIQHGGFEFNCNNCHQHFEPPEISRKLIGAHQDIIIHHEEAMTCYTCHSRDNHEKLNDIYKTEVAFENSENICRRCHGPRYRDWKLGIHGRPTGYWDKTQGESKNITCVYCHNPHAPKFQLMEPSPPPHRDNYISGKKGLHHE